MTDRKNGEVHPKDEVVDIIGLGQDHVQDQEVQDHTDVQVLDQGGAPVQDQDGEAGIAHLKVVVVVAVTVEVEVKAEKEKETV